MSTAGAKVSSGDLRRFTRDVFCAAGMAAAPAAIVAEVLVWANLRGIDSHGVQRLPRYLEMIADGDLNPRPVFTTRSESAASLLVDADRGAGPVAMLFALDEAMRRARAAGVGLVLVSRTTHTAALGYYTAKAAQDGMAALAFSASVPNMIYHGARAAGVSTSPLSIAVPGGEAGPLLLDMATSVVSMGRLLTARKTGQALGAGWAVDAGGEPTTDAAAAVLPLPVGGAKGSGLALMFECLASVLGGNPILADALSGAGDGKRHRQNAVILAIDVAKFGDLAAFRAQITRLAVVLKALPLAAGIDAIRLPGERGDRVQAQRSRDGIPLPGAIREDLARVGARFGIAFPT